MQTSEFKKVGRLLKETYKKLEQEALKEGIDLLSPEYDQLIALARQRVLDELGFTLEEYRQAKELVAGISKEGTLAVMKDTQDKLEDLSKLHIPTTEEITQIAHDVARQYIKPPQITNEIVKETIIEKPIKETVEIIQRVEYDETPLQEKLGELSKRVDEIKIPDVDKLKEDLGSDFAKQFEKNINTLDMPNFRKLAMGLQQQIDALGGATPANAVPYTGATGDVDLGSNDLSVEDEAYSSSWNGSLEVPTKNAVYDKIESFGFTDWIDYSATSTIVGWSSFTIKQLRYQVAHKRVYVNFYLTGTSNSTSLTFTLPTASPIEIMNVCRIIDNGTSGVGRFFMNASSNTVTVNSDVAGAAWTASNQKFCAATFFYEIA